MLANGWFRRRCMGPAAMHGCGWRMGMMPGRERCRARARWRCRAGDDAGAAAPAGPSGFAGPRSPPGACAVPSASVGAERERGAERARAGPSARARGRRINVRPAHAVPNTHPRAMPCTQHLNFARRNTQRCEFIAANTKAAAGIAPTLALGPTACSTVWHAHEMCSVCGHK